MALNNEVPVFVDGKTSEVINHGSQCVKDISAGVDTGLWALSCKHIHDFGEDGNFNIIKWDPFRKVWYTVPGIKGAKLAAFNEISVAVLTSDGKIVINYIDGKTDPIDITPPINITDPVWPHVPFVPVINGTDVQLNITNGTTGQQVFHIICSGSGPSITVVRTISRQTITGITPNSWIDQFGRDSGRKDFVLTITSESLVHYLNPTEAAKQLQPTTTLDDLEFYLSDNCQYSATDARSWGYAATVIEGEGEIHPAFLLNFDGNSFQKAGYQIAPKI